MKKTILFLILILSTTCTFGADKTEARIQALEKRIRILEAQVNRPRVTRRYYRPYKTFDVDRWYELQRHGMGNTDPDLFQ